MKNAIDPCPLCTSEGALFFSKDRYRDYYHCLKCDIIYVPSRFHLTPQQEKDRYDLHKNNPNDPGYRKFLSGLVNSIAEIVPTGSKGLDFGSGPEPVMANMLEDLGYQMKIFDKHYANNQQVLTQQYDFITCCETIEHFTNPEKELALLFRILKPGGWLGIQTSLHVQQVQKFDKWYYIRDLTHICFFSEQSFNWISHEFETSVTKISQSVFIFKKS